MVLSLTCVRGAVMTDFIEFEVDEDEVMRGFDLQEKLVRAWLKDFMGDMADLGTEVLEHYAPEWTGYTHRHIDHTSLRWHPGGAGGGGTYEIVVGVKAGTSYHPVYPNVGTGYWGPTQNLIRSPKGNLMYFYASRLGHVISKYEVVGQKPQFYLYDTWRDMARILDLRLSTEFLL